MVNPQKTEYFVEIEVSIHGSTAMLCKVLPPKDFLTYFRRATRQWELKTISTDPLKLLLVCGWNQHCSQNTPSFSCKWN